MYRAFIADDEAYVRDGLKKHFPWARYGLELSGMAADGIEALEMLLKNPVDLLITDVKMPRMNGIELVRTLAQRGVRCKVIFISGYDDVDYLRSALKLDAIDYIMKSIDLEEMEATVRKVVAIMDAQREEAARQDRMEAQLHSGMPLLREKTLTALLQDCVSETTLRECALLEPALKPDGRFCLGVMETVNLSGLYGGKSEGEKRLLSLGMVSALQEQMLTELNGHLFENEPGVLIALAVAEDGASAACERRMERFLETAASMLQRLSGCSFHTCRSDVVQGFAALKDAYAKARRDVPAHQTPQTLRPVFSPTRRRELLAALGACDKAAVRELLAEAFLEATRQGDEPEQRIALFAVLMLPAELVSELSMENEYNMLQICERFFLCQTAGRRREFVTSAYETLLQALEARRRNQGDALVEQMKSVIRQRFCEDLQVVDVAQAVYLTAPYACQLFKQGTGMTIGQYLTSQRIEKAKELLADPENKTYDVGYAVGYSAPSYFSQLFKRSTGFTPSRYRDMLASKSEEIRPL